MHGWYKPPMPPAKSPHFLCRSSRWCPPGGFSSRLSRPGCVGSAGTVGFSGHNVTKASRRFIADPPFGSVRGVANGDGIVVSDTIGRLKSFHHELLHNRGGKPSGTQTHINFRCLQFSNESYAALKEVWKRSTILIFFCLCSESCLVRFARSQSGTYPKRIIRRSGP